MKNVEIYSTPSCHFCHMAKDFFAENSVPFTDFNVASDPTKRAEMVDISGQLGVPVIVVDKQDVIIGFNKNLLSKLLDIKEA